MPPAKQYPQIDEMAAQLTKYKLWSRLFDSLNVGYHGLQNSEFYFRCKNCGGYSIRFDVARLHWVCVCPEQKSYPRTSWLKLLLYQTVSMRLTAEDILNEAAEIISEHEKVIEETKAATRLRNKQYGVYEVN